MQGWDAAAERKALADLHRETPEWEVVNEHHIKRTFKFPDPSEGMLAFVNRSSAKIAEKGKDTIRILRLGWGKAEVTTWTHSVDGLTESDFILAAKVDRIKT